MLQLGNRRFYGLDEISETIEVKPKHAGKSYRKIVSRLDIRVPIIDHNRYVIRIANKLSLDELTRRRALDLLDQARKKDILEGKDPTSIAASILYLVRFGEQKSHRTQGEIAKAVGITEVTIINRSKELQERLGIRQ
jgi:transcription initiation factor TFIIB